MFVCLAHAFTHQSLETSLHACMCNIDPSSIPHFTITIFSQAGDQEMRPRFVVSDGDEDEYISSEVTLLYDNCMIN